MKMLPQVLFWLGLISVPFAWLVWYFGSEIEIIRPVLAGIKDPALRAALQEAHAERLGIWVAVWPVSLLIMSQILEKKNAGIGNTFAAADEALPLLACKSLVNRAARGLLTEVLRRLCSVVSNRRVRPVPPCGPDWRGSNAIRPIETTRVHEKV